MSPQKLHQGSYRIYACRVVSVRTKNLGKDIFAGLKSLVGGEVKELTDMQNEARMIAVGRLSEKAESLGANAIIGLRLASSSIMNGASEMIAYGTDVYIEDAE